MFSILLEHRPNDLADPASRDERGVHIVTCIKYQGKVLLDAI